MAKLKERAWRDDPNERLCDIEIKFLLFWYIPWHYVRYMNQFSIAFCDWWAKLLFPAKCSPKTHSNPFSLPWYFLYMSLGKHLPSNFLSRLQGSWFPCLVHSSKMRCHKHVHLRKTTGEIDMLLGVHHHISQTIITEIYLGAHLFISETNTLRSCFICFFIKTSI